MVWARCCVCTTEAKGHRDPLNFLSGYSERGPRQESPSPALPASEPHRWCVGAVLCAQQKRSSTDTHTGMFLLQVHP